MNREKVLKWLGWVIAAASIAVDYLQKSGVRHG